MYIEKNQLINITITGIKSTSGNELQEVQAFFTTEMSPMLSSINQVRQLIGSYLDGITEDIVNQLILKYSNEARVTSSCMPDAKWNFYATKWVTLRVAIDILYNSKIYLGESGGKAYKKLGDFAISRDTSSDSGGPVKRMIDKLECDAFKFSIAVKHCAEPLLTCKDIDNYSLHKKTAAQSVIKGEQDLNRPTFGRSFSLTGKDPAMRKWVQVYRRKYQTNDRRR